MLAANSSVGPPQQPPPPPPPTPSAPPPPTLLTVNGILPGQQMNAQPVNRPAPVLTPAFFPNATAFASYPVPFSGPTSVLPCIASPPTGTIFQGPGGPFPFNMAGSMLVTQPQPVINGTPVNFPSFAQPGSVPQSVPNSAATVVLTGPITSDVCFTSTGSLPIIPNGTTSIAPSTSAPAAPLVTTLNTSIDSTPPIKCKPEVKPVVSVMNLEANIAALEKNDFHKGLILDAIDKLRERKARPDLERISCLLRRQHNISPAETQVCLTRLAENGSVFCVDYKGNLSYRNPSKWRKTAIPSIGATNRPNVSKRLVDAVKSLMKEGSSETPQGFTLLQIEQAVKELQPAATQPSGDQPSEEAASVPIPELTGSTLRICLDREATYGKLAKLNDGKYVLDESGEKKRANALNRKPLPGKIAANGVFGKPIAPAIDALSARSQGVLSIGAGRPLARRLPFPGNKRGRPPSIKAKKMLAPCPQQPILPAPPDNFVDKVRVPFPCLYIFPCLFPVGRR